MPATFQRHWKLERSNYRCPWACCVILCNVCFMSHLMQQLCYVKAICVKLPFPEELGCRYRDSSGGWSSDRTWWVQTLQDTNYLKGGYKHTDSWGCGKMVWPQIHLGKKEKLATGLWGKLFQILFGKINGPVGSVLNRKRISFKWGILWKFWPSSTVGGKRIKELTDSKSFSSKATGVYTRSPSVRQRFCEPKTQQ